MTNCIFNHYSRYYDLLYRDKDYMGEALYIQNLLTRFGILKGDILEFGSGTGRHGCLLADNGYMVHGIERSIEMVAKANKANGFTCEQGDITLTKMNRTYDVVLSLFHVLSYQVTNEQVKLVFSNAFEHLSKGGLFVFDFWYSPAVYSQRPEVRLKRMSDERVEVIRVAEPVIHHNDNIVDVNYTIITRELEAGLVQTFNERHSMRHFSLPELDVIANMHGFERIKAEEFLTGNLPSENTWGVCCAFRRK
jgi:SAM-dependent methyltransferase